MNKIKENKKMVGFGLLVVLIGLLSLGILLANDGNGLNLGGGTGTATFIVTADEDNSREEVIEFEEGATMFAVLEEYFDAQETDGFVYSIDGVEQDEEEGMYWVYDLNEEMGLESALEYELQDGDLVEWELTQF